MTDQVQITIDQEVYDRLQMLMVPPISDANAVIKALLYHNGSDSPAVVALKADEQHFTYEQELERSSQGFYDGRGATLSRLARCGFSWRGSRHGGRP